MLRHRTLVRFLDPERDRDAIRRRIARLHHSADMGIGWALRELHEDPTSPADRLFVTCFKGVWALSLAGLHGQARALLERIRPAVSSRGEVQAMPPSLHHYVYRHCFLTIGASEVGERSLFEPISSFVASEQDRRTGGFWSQPQRSSERWIDTSTTALGGMVLLRRGEVDPAVRAAEFLGWVMHSQPAPHEVFFTTVGEEGQLVADGSLPRHRAIHVALQGHPWSIICLAPLFLTELYEHTEENAYLELATEYINYVRHCKAKDRFFAPDSGKAAAAAAELHRLTRNKVYAQIALSSTAYMVSKQTGSGGWSWSETGQGDLDRTLDHVLWLRRVATSLESGDS